MLQRQHLSIDIFEKIGVNYVVYKNKIVSSDVPDLILNVFKKSTKNTLNASEICKKTSLTKRQVRYTLDKLVKSGLLIKTPNFEDFRSYLYSIKENERKNENLFDSIDHLVFNI
jgi:DNA-binding transcriptional ArsR family regulator